MLKIPLRVHNGMHADETAEHCHWHVHGKHYLEGWSDARAFDGTASIVQPLIAPLYDGKGVHEVVQLFLKNFRQKDYDIVKEYWQKTNITPAAATAAAPAKTEAKTDAKVATPAPAAKKELQKQPQRLRHLLLRPRSRQRILKIIGVKRSTTALFLIRLQRRKPLPQQQHF